MSDNIYRDTEIFDNGLKEGYELACEEVRELLEDELSKRYNDVHKYIRTGDRSIFHEAVHKVDYILGLIDKILELGESAKFNEVKE